MHFFVRVIKYFLWFLLSIILLLLFFGLSKTHRNLGAYITFLDATNWSVFHISQPSTWGDPFLPNNQLSGSIADILTGEADDTSFSGLDVYDPAFEEDLNSMSEDVLSGTAEEPYGFAATGQTSTDTSSSGNAKSQLYDLIKKSIQK